MIYFTSDWHIGHKNIIKYCKRPFDNCDDMAITILSNYRNTVEKDDTVYFIGDIFWHSQSVYMKEVLDSLPGKKVLIRGNHDNTHDFKYINAGFESVHDTLNLRYRSYDFTLAHDPAISQTDRTAKFLCGHVHDLFLRTKNVLNVGVDVWEFKLVSGLTAINMLYCF